MIHLDTHAVIWLYERRLDAFPVRLRQRMDVRRPLVSPMVRLELALLHQVGRLVPTAEEVLADLHERADLGVAESSFDRVAAIACGFSWTRDPFDRLIAAHAQADDVPLVTKDATILANCRVAIWD
jgi:PIN domain nuclease of toxin-antitoxin system